MLKEPVTGETLTQSWMSASEDPGHLTRRSGALWTAPGGALALTSAALPVKCTERLSAALYLLYSM